MLNTTTIRIKDSNNVKLCYTYLFIAYQYRKVLNVCQHQHIYQGNLAVPLGVRIASYYLGLQLGIIVDYKTKRQNQAKH